MTNPRVMFGIWLAFAFVTWNVVFDRGVAVAGIEFTRHQIVRHQQGAPLALVDDAFSPRVRAAAVEALWYAGAVVVVGAAFSWRARQPSNPRHPRHPRITA